MRSKARKEMPQKDFLVMVVEDETPLQDAIKTKLKKEKLGYIPATTAEQGLEILKKQKPDIIWLDLLLPGMGGFEFLERLRKKPELKSLPVVIVSVSASPEKIRRAFELNVVDYLVKSQYQLNDIVRRIKSFLYKQLPK
jgi:CheY-like chemotaxis protein